MNSEDKKLRMTFDPNTIQHLGIKMYSNLPAAIAELVANSYDADAENVEIILHDDGMTKSLDVKDDGFGMSFDEVNKYFLKIGRNRRSEEMKITPEGRTATGKKGLGKLALFGIGNEIKVITHKKNEKQYTEFSLNWEELKTWDSSKSPDYMPHFDLHDTKEINAFTKITISNLKRKSNFKPEDLAASLSKMFNFIDAHFKITIKLNNENPISIDNKLKYQGIDKQFYWNYPKSFSGFESKYENKDKIKGEIITSEKPLKPNLRGITLFANGRMVNLPEFFGRAESSHFFSYTTGWLNVDFIDEGIGDEDLISTNRQSLDWEKNETVKLRFFLQEMLIFVQREWRKKRKELNRKETSPQIGFDREKWLSSIPSDKANIIERAIDAIAEPDAKENPIFIFEQAMHEIVPEYATLHWRYLNTAITESNVVERLYKQGNYFQAASEAVKLYISKVREISKVTGQSSDYQIMMHAFGREETKPISLTKRKDEIETDIEEGQKFYSGGLVTGFKNPVSSHSTEEELKKRGLFSEKDCLDILSLLSHLFDRLNKREKPKIVYDH
ncbi:MAG: TIGR02391 family protein [Lentisphaerae bacterium GWF2_44_16]|nr:MAG: TIGR02391 family protein [Lentisphaerae bacterium GWF2_44_16]